MRPRGEKPRARTLVVLPRPGVSSWGRERPDFCSQTGTRQLQTPSAAPDGLAPSGFYPFSGAVRAASFDFSPKSKEDTKRKTASLDSHRAPEAWCSQKGTLQAQNAEAWGHCRPEFPTRLPTDWHRRLLTLVSNTPWTKWCGSGSPGFFFAVAPFVVCCGRRVS